MDPGDFNMCLTAQYQQCMQEDNCVFPKCLGLATKCVILTTVWDVVSFSDVMCVCVCSVYLYLPLSSAVPYIHLSCACTFS